MPLSPDDPGMESFARGDPVDHERFNRWQSKTITNISATGSGVRTLRKGNTFAMHFPKQKSRRSTEMFPVSILSAAGPGALYNGSRLDMSGATAINPSVGTITQEMIGAVDPTPIYVVCLTEINLLSHDLAGTIRNVALFAAWWHPLPATDGVRVALTWGFDWVRCSQGVTAAELNFI